MTKTMARAAVVAALMALGATGALAQGQTGAIFTTDAACQGTNLNIYAAKSDVYLNGGPARTGAAGLPDGNYYVQVTEPNGDVLGKSVLAAVVVAGGEFVECYQLTAILQTASSGFTTPGYDDTPNPGGEYKVWASLNPEFANNDSKTDNFKVKPPEPEDATLEVIKFYDANANGLNDDGQLISGWQVSVKHDHAAQGEPDHEGADYVRSTPVSIIVDPGTYIVTESDPIETNWLGTTANPVTVAVPANGTASVEFGNLCLGAGGGKTLGFWSNKNGQATMGANTAAHLEALSSLDLRAADGTAFDPATYAAFRAWLLSANATNMAYMLSAQLSATTLNVRTGGVSETALVHAPGCGNAGVGSAFISIADLTAAANAALADPNGLTLAEHPDRAAQECLKTALDKSNNNLNFVQSGACAFSFAQ